MRLKYGTELPRFATSALLTAWVLGSLERIKDDVADGVDGNVDVVDGADSDGLHFVASVQPERKETERGPIC